MDFEGFNKWLVESKGISQRSTNDVLSRVRRVMKILNVDEISQDTKTSLVKNESFQETSRFIQAQLKRAVILYSEFLAEK